jgi:hypothetical protein
MDEVWAFPWWLQLRRACLLEAKYEVAWLKGPSAYPSAVVIAEALLVNCRTGEGDVPSFIQQVLGISQCLFLRLLRRKPPRGVRSSIGPMVVL